ncbi:MAG: type II toxin-antitoxin system VapC family toxin [Paludibacterium sp.]|uniref:type II toxin-antitoxin system VapC family toxin n=1 Tax=Paludibacterium sp. TaxID=1917523 RepID=UPI0025D3828A|nr:type II toxin-antitoxin system VapC family toxin [Paludibacterium sp.]MBV8048678.1 type II toxin-antitoxin system VapC family toxin [Paludibacterium sp.]
MNVLLDTHIALWAIVDDPKLPKAAREMLLRPEVRVYTSTVSLWEIAVKHSLGKLPISSQYAQSAFNAAGFDSLPILPEHVTRTEELPWIHKDPFDRMLIAQALTEPMRLLTVDSKFGGYPGLIQLL